MRLIPEQPLFRTDQQAGDVEGDLVWLMPYSGSQAPTAQ